MKEPWKKHKKTVANLPINEKKIVILHRYQKRPRKDAGAVERDGLENRCTLTGTQGSNPCLSAEWLKPVYPVHQGKLVFIIIS